MNQFAPDIASDVFSAFPLPNFNGGKPVVLGGIDIGISLNKNITKDKAALSTPPAAPQPGAPAAAAMAFDPTALRATWASVRSELAWPAQGGQ